MVKKKTSTTDTSTKDEPSPVTQILSSYTKASENLYFKHVSLNDLSKIKNEINKEIPLLRKNGISAILVDGVKKKEYLAPGIDPYVVRLKFDEAIERENAKKAAKEKKEADEDDSKSSSSTSSK